MSNSKRFSLLFLTLILLLTISGCFHARGFNGGYHHYNSYKGSYDRDHHGYDHHKSYDRNYYRR